MKTSSIIQKILYVIYPNTKNEIDAQKHQDLEKAIVQSMVNKDDDENTLQGKLIVKGGISAQNKKIEDVLDGEKETDVVTVGQMSRAIGPYKIIVVKTIESLLSACNDIQTTNSAGIILLANDLSMSSDLTINLNATQLWFNGFSIIQNEHVIRIKGNNWITMNGFLRRNSESYSTHTSTQFTGIHVLGDADSVDNEDTCYSTYQIDGRFKDMTFNNYVGEADDDTPHLITAKYNDASAALYFESCMYSSVTGHENNEGKEPSITNVAFKISFNGCYGGLYIDKHRTPNQLSGNVSFLVKVVGSNGAGISSDYSVNVANDVIIDPATKAAGAEVSFTGYTYALKSFIELRKAAETLSGSNKLLISTDEALMKNVTLDILKAWILEGMTVGDGYATEAFVAQKIADLVNSAPTVLDTLKEISAALNNDPSFSTTVTTAITNAIATAEAYATTKANAAISASATYTNASHDPSSLAADTLSNNDLLSFWDIVDGVRKKITWSNFRSIFVNLADINVSSWADGEQRLLMVKNSAGTAQFDSAAELLDIFAPPAVATALTVDSGWTNESKTITGDNTLGALGKVGQIIWLDNKTYCQCVAATYTSSASVTYNRNRAFDNLDPQNNTQDAAVLAVLDPSLTYPSGTPTAVSTDYGWDLASQIKVLTVAARVGTWAAGGLAGEGYMYFCFKVSGSNSYWKRNGNPSFVQREITTTSHPTLVAALRAYDWNVGKYTQSALETSYQDQAFSDDANGYYYIKTDATKWSRFDALILPKKTTITNAQVKAMATTAITVVAQADSGYMHAVRSLLVNFKAGTEALTVGGDTVFVVRYAGGATIASFAGMGFVDSTTSNSRFTTEITISDNTANLGNRAIEIVNTGTQISGNAAANASIDVLVDYYTIKI